MTIDKLTGALALFIALASAACGRNANPTTPTAGSGVNVSSVPATPSADGRDEEADFLGKVGEPKSRKLEPRRPLVANCG